MGGLLLDDCSFGTPCCCEHNPGGEADPQVLLLQAQQLGTVLQRLTRLVLDGAATWKTKRRAKNQPPRAIRTKKPSKREPVGFREATFDV